MAEQFSYIVKVLLANTLDIQGGAARAAYRLHRALLATDVDSQMLVQSKFSDDWTVLGFESKIQKGLAMLRPSLDALPVRFYKNRTQTVFSPAWLPFSSNVKRINSLNPDVVHLHWICGGMLRVEDIAKIKAPIIWTLHDMWAFTGGCHYSADCSRFTEQCRNCPELKRSGQHDLSYLIFSRKMKAWKNLNITIVTPSRWLASLARQSKLFRNHRIDVIANGIDLNCFKPVDQQIAREIWGLPKDKKLLLFGAMNAASDQRKGFDLLYESIKNQEIKQNVELVVFGSRRPQSPPDFGLPVHYLGQLHDEVSLALLYSAVDVMVIPSREDNLPNTAVESLACGTPVVAFKIGGLEDIVDHEQNGYLANAFDCADLTRGINWVLAKSTKYELLSQNARLKAERSFDSELITQRYIELYQSLL